MWKVMRGGKVVAYGSDATEPTKEEQRMLKNHGYKVLVGLEDDNPSGPAGHLPLHKGGLTPQSEIGDF
jgi:hypothetical protein